MYAGKFAPSQADLEEVLAIYDPISHGSLVSQAGIHPHVNALGLLGNVLFYLGHPDQSSSRSNAAIGEARRLAHPPSLTATLGFSAGLLSLVGDTYTLAQRAEELIAMATEHGFPHWRALGMIYRGWAKLKNGDVGEGISLLCGGSIAYRATGAKVWTPLGLALLASAREIAGQIMEAVSELDDALEMVAITGERWFAAELNRRKGQLLLRQGRAEAAEELYHKALSIAREQEARLWELRAAVSLARLRRDQGRSAEARALLAPVYGWFTEGFDTPDLREAKALLDALDA